MNNLKGGLFQKGGYVMSCQRDPLSPYLSIFLYRSPYWKYLERGKREALDGPKISCAGPAVSHFLFANDSLLFCKATSAECGVILKLLKDYEAASGQLLNFDKSSLQFGHKVPEGKHLETKSQLGINAMGVWVTIWVYRRV